MKVSDIRKAHELLIERDKVQRAWLISRSSYAEAKAVVSRSSSNETIDLADLLDVKRVLMTALENRNIDLSSRLAALGVTPDEEAANAN